MSEAIIDEIDEQTMYQKFELVWAKILGWPWWPARITQIPSEKNGNYKVQFLADTSHAFLPYQKLMSYEQGRDRHSTPKGHYRNFTKALALADKLIQSNPTPKDEARTHYTSREKLPDQQIQIINQSQQVQTNQKHENQNKSQLQQHSNESIQIRKTTKKWNSHLNKRDRRCNILMKKKNTKQLQAQLNQLLKKYHLDGNICESLKNDQLKSIKKRKLIVKQSGSEKGENSFQTETKLARIICKALSSKDINLQERQKITGTLMSALFLHKERGVQGMHRALFQWIRCNDAETIQQNYKLWPIQTKCDHFTDCF